MLRKSLNVSSKFCSYYLLGLGPKMKKKMVEIEDKLKASFGNSKEALVVEDEDLETDLEVIEGLLKEVPSIYQGLDPRPAGISLSVVDSGETDPSPPKHVFPCSGGESPAGKLCSGARRNRYIGRRAVTLITMPIIKTGGADACTRCILCKRIFMVRRGLCSPASLC